MATYNTHYLIPLHIEYWKRAGEEVRFWIADDSGQPPPVELPSCVNIVPFKSPHTYDGAIYGYALDMIVRLTSPDSKYIIINDTDFFWLHPNIWKLFLSLQIDCFGIGDNCILNMGYWEENESNLDEIHSSSVPFLSGMIIRRDIALKHTFELKQEEAQRYSYEVGWRCRHELMQDKYSYKNLLGFRYYDQLKVYDDVEENSCINNHPVFYGTPKKPYGVHILQATRRQPSFNRIYDLIEKYRSFHDNSLHSHS